MNLKKNIDKNKLIKNKTLFPRYRNDVPIIRVIVIETFSKLIFQTCFNCKRWKYSNKKNINKINAFSLV